MNKNNSRIKKPDYFKERFFIVVGLIACSYLASILLTIFSFCTKVEIDDNNLYNALGISCQVVATICTCVLSILQISLSLQDNTILGISVRALYRMRKKPHFGFATNVLISLGFIILAILGYMSGSLYACIIPSISTIAFCVYLVVIESPYLCMQDKIMLKIVRDRLIAEYCNTINAGDYQAAEVVEILEALIINKNLIWTYKQLTNTVDDDYKKYILLRLMDVQTNIAFNLDKVETVGQLTKVTDELLDTACAMASSKFDIVEILGDKPKEYLHYVTSVLFQLLKNKLSKEKAKIRIAETIKIDSALNNKDGNEAKSYLFFSIATILVVETVKNNDFSLIKELKKSLSVYPYLLQEKGLSRIFAMVSFVLYYLSKIESTVPQEVKKNIDDIVQKSYVEDDYKVLSWKTLFNYFGKSYNVTLENFLSDFSANHYYYEFSLRSCEAYNLIFTKELAFDWYMATYLNSKKNYDTDFNTFFPIRNNQWIVQRLKVIEDSCYINHGSFSPNNQLKEMAEFYSESNRVFEIFSSAENCRYEFRNYIDTLRKIEFEDNIKASSTMKHQDRIKSIQKDIELKLKKPFGFDNNIDVSNDKKLSFSLLMGWNSNAYIADWFVKNILHTIWDQSIKIFSHCIKTDNNFAKEIKDKILKKDIEYITNSAKYYAYMINDKKVQNEYLEKIEKATISDDGNNLFAKPTFIMKGGFSYNCQVQLDVRDLTPEMINQEVDGYRRTDGQYVYEGAFLTREELCRIIEKTLFIYQVVFSYKININEDAIFYLS